MMLNNGMHVTLSEENGWQATVSDLPVVVGGLQMVYFWKEQEVPGYINAGVKVIGGVTVFTNSLASHRETEPPEGKPLPPQKKPSYLIISDYGTPLGVDVSINHVGDCFD